MSESDDVVNFTGHIYINFLSFQFQESLDIIPDSLDMSFYALGIFICNFTALILGELRFS